MDILFPLLLCGGILFSLLRGGGEAVMASLLSGGTEALNLCIRMWGGYMFWMGILEILRRGGLMEGLSRLLSPAVRTLFPSAGEAVPAITLHLAANMLGMGSAAAPFGLEAMEKLEACNPHPGRATREMCTLLMLNAACPELLPTAPMAMRQAWGSLHPESIWLPALLASLCAFSAAVVICLYTNKKVSP